MVKMALHDLIQSMTMSEKRYFKIYSSKHVIGLSNDYVLLFDALDAQVIYDEESLKGKEFVKNLSAEKNYLYRLILKSLNAFHVNLNSKTQIYQWLESVEILFHKGMYDQALKIVKKAKKVAVENELFTQLLTIEEIETELLSKDFNYSEASKNISETEETILVIENFNALQKITTDCYDQMLKFGTSRSEKESKLMAEFLNNQYIKDPNYPKSERAKMYVYGLKLTHAFFVNDLKTMLKYTEAMTALYHKCPYLIEYSTIGYVSSLYNLATTYQKLGNRKKVVETLEELEETMDKYNVSTSMNIGSRIFFYSTNIRLDLYLQEDDYDLVKELLEEREGDFHRFKSFIGKPQLYEYYFLIAKYYIVISDYKNALKYTNEIINDTSFKVREDLMAVVRLMNLLIHYELNREFTLEYLTKNTFNYFKKKDRLFKVEKELIKFMSKQHQLEDEASLISDLKQLKNKMKEFKKDKYEATPFELFDFEYWAEARIANKKIVNLSK